MSPARDSMISRTSCCGYRRRPSGGRRHHRAELLQGPLPQGLVLAHGLRRADGGGVGGVDMDYHLGRAHRCGDRHRGLGDHFPVDFRPLVLLFVFAVLLWAVYAVVELLSYRKDWIAGGFLPVNDRLIRQRKRDERERRRVERKAEREAEKAQSRRRVPRGRRKPERSNTDGMTSSRFVPRRIHITMRVWTASQS